MRHRTVIAFFVAPIAPIIAFTLITTASPAEFARSLAGLLLLGALPSYIAAFWLGVPAYLWLVSRGLTGLHWFLIGGFIIGGASAALVILAFTREIATAFGASFSFGLYGVASALVFWIIAWPKHR
jgi:hypothetical protein